MRVHCEVSLKAILGGWWLNQSSPRLKPVETTQETSKTLPSSRLNHKSIRCGQFLKLLLWIGEPPLGFLSRQEESGWLLGSSVLWKNNNFIINIYPFFIFFPCIRGYPLRIHVFFHVGIVSNPKGSPGTASHLTGFMRHRGGRGEPRPRTMVPYGPMGSSHGEGLESFESLILPTCRHRHRRLAAPKCGKWS